MIDTAVLWVRAEAAIRARRYHDALPNLFKLLGVVDRIDFEYEEWLRALVECLRATGAHEQAATCVAYLGATEPPDATEIDAALAGARGGDATVILGLRLRGVYLSRAGHHLPAAAYFAAADMPVHQAIELERAGRDADAATLWSSMIERDRFTEHPYELALARINYGLCLYRTGSDRARAALAEATTTVEEVADRFESEGLRERAFDCYQLLARIGIETRAFENVAEGYLNSVRILRDDALKLDALRLYEAFVGLARQAAEHHAVATILREAADYCLRSGLPYGDDLRLRCGDAWMKAAEEAQAVGHPVQIVENAYLAAAEAYVSVRAFGMAKNAYECLSELEVRGRERFRRLLERLEGAPEDPPRPVPVPEFLKRLPDYEEVWYVDLAEWELEGEPALIAAGVMADKRFPDFVRRHGLLLTLEVLRRGSDLPVLDVVERLKSIRAYPVIAALETMYWRGNAEVQQEVAAAMGSLRFKRSFAILDAALRSTEAGVRHEAARSVAELFFPHAFDRLRRIYESRDLPDGETAKLAALKAVGRINTVEALEFLCDRLRDGGQPYVGHALAAIAELSNADLAPYLRQQVDLVPPLHRSVVEDAAHRLGA